MTLDQLVPLIELALIGLAAGFLAGLLGVGGGVLIVPALVLILGFDQHIAQGTSLLVIIPAALTGSWTHYRNGRLVMRDAGTLAVGGVIGAVIGSVFALSIEGSVLQRLFAIFLLVAALRILMPKDLFRRRGQSASQDGRDSEMPRDGSSST